MPNVQYYKGDAQEIKIFNSGIPILDSLESGKNDFFDNAFSCYILGEVIFDSQSSPLANAIPRNVFRESFSAIFDSFLEAGSFEAYLTVFRKVFGPEVEVTFSVPAPGKLNIGIVATNLVTNYFLSRTIVGDAYIFDEITDRSSDQVLFQTIKGLESQYELEKMLFEMVPDGIYTNVTLSVGA